ncbi:MAG: ABC transporter ATP-binding protein [Actinobacteria bacterium]|nr:ABC transporter ATP-binding protein [Actinomycetota bacterium]
MTYKGLGGDVLALSDLDLTLAEGEPISIIGPSGGGKSTTLLLAAGLLKPTKGEVKVSGETVTGPRNTTSLILQDFGLLPWKTVEQNAALGLKIRKFTKKQQDERTAQALDQVGLTEFASSYPNELSGGMRQRLALARAVALDSDLLLMDEPLSALDALLREKLQDTLLSLWKDIGYSQILVTHSIEEAVFLGKRIVLMSPRPGRVAAIVENPEMGDADYRFNPSFHECCEKLRSLLVGQGTLAEGRVDE